MADQTKRNPLKRLKDRKQGLALLNSVVEVMPQFWWMQPLNKAFRPS
jgi:hypothetical protein